MKKVVFAMPTEYARIARSVGKALSERQGAIISEPLPQSLVELLCNLSESARRRSRTGEGTRLLSALVQLRANQALECRSFKFGHVENAVSGSIQDAFRLDRVGIFQRPQC